MKCIQKIKIEVEGTIRVQISEFNYFGHVVSETKQDIEVKVHKYNKINGAVQRHFAKETTENTTSHEGRQ